MGVYGILMPNASGKAEEISACVSVYPPPGSSEMILHMYMTPVTDPGPPPEF